MACHSVHREPGGAAADRGCADGRRADDLETGRGGVLSRGPGRARLRLPAATRHSRSNSRRAPPHLRPFGVNLLVPQPFVVDQAQVRSALDLLAPFAAAVGVRLAMPNAFAEDFEAQLEVVLDERVPFFSFTFGIPPGDALAALRDSGIVTCGTATSVAEAEALAAAVWTWPARRPAKRAGTREGSSATPPLAPLPSSRSFRSSAMPCGSRSSPREDSWTGVVSAPPSPWARGGAARHRVPALPGGRNQRAVPPGGCGCHRDRHRAHLGVFG